MAHFGQTGLKQGPLGTPSNFTSSGTYTDVADLSGAAFGFVGIITTKRNMGSVATVQMKLYGSYDQKQWYIINTPLDADGTDYQPWSINWTTSLNLTSPVESGNGEFNWVAAAGGSQPFPIPFPFVKGKIFAINGSPGNDASVIIKLVAF